MKIVSLSTHEMKIDGQDVFILLVTYYNYATGDGVVVSMTFDTPEDMHDSMDALAKVAKLQGGEEIDGHDESPFSAN